MRLFLEGEGKRLARGESMLFSLPQSFLLGSSTAFIVEALGLQSVVGAATGALNFDLYNLANAKQAATVAALDFVVIHSKHLEALPIRC